MGTLLASALIARMRRTLLDPSPGTNWDDDDLLDALNEAQRRIALVKPEVFPVRTTLSLAAGTKQVLADGDIALLDIYENVVSGMRIRGPVQRGLLDESARGHPAATPEVDVDNFTIDTRNPTTFDVYPPNNGTGQIRLLVGRTPAPIAAVGNPIVLADIYEGPMRFFALAECYSENTKRQDMTKAELYEGRALKALGMRSQGQVNVAPRVGKQGGA